jgi:L-threonylcarbamoyladenylate synthase
MIIETIEEALNLLNVGELVAIPTETVYGLAAPIFNTNSVQKIFTIKKRPADNPLIAHISSLAMVEQVAEHIPASFERLLKFWPGPLAVVLPKKATVSSLVSGGHLSIAVRMPSHPLALALIKALGCPLVAPSANLSGRPSPTSAAHVLQDLKVAVLDGGPCTIGIESTVLSLVHSVPTLLRPGKITLEQLEDALQEKVELALEGGPNLSPGMKYRHYAPKGTIHIVESPPTFPAFILSNPGLRPLNSETFYAYLREADLLGVSDIYIVLDSGLRSDAGLMNRILRSAGVAK